jgi:gluconolactonase
MRLMIPALALAALSSSASAAEPTPIKSLTPPYPTFGSVERLDPALDKLIAPDAKLEKLAEGFTWSEGPVWVKDGGFLLFSDVPRDTVFRWKEGEGAKPFITPSGHSSDVLPRNEPGSNGLTVDNEGRLVLCQHGDRRVARFDLKSGTMSPIVDKFEGKRFNSPNDLVYDKAGNLFFTDPPYGLPKGMDDKTKELDFQGVFRFGKDGKLTLVTKLVERPNGIAISPDQKTLYIASSHPPRAVWLAFDLKEDGTVADPAGRVFFDSTKLVADANPGLPDGMKIDDAGNLFATGPGGVFVFTPDGKHLGTVHTGQPSGNCAFGDDGTSLYIMANHYLSRIKLLTHGTPPGPAK